jgi:hypothetical protein
MARNVALTAPAPLSCSAAVPVALKLPCRVPAEGIEEVAVPLLVKVETNDPDADT